MPPGKFFTMFHFLEYPFSRGETHIVSPDPYEAPDFDAGFMNDERDMAPMVWGYIKSRETARRMDAYAGEVQSMHPFYAFDSPARAKDMDLATTKAYALPGNLTAGIQHGSWSMPLEPGKPAKISLLNSNRQDLYEDLKYSKEDIKHVEEWVKRHVSIILSLSLSIPALVTLGPKALKQLLGALATGCCDHSASWRSPESH